MQAPHPFEANTEASALSTPLLTTDQVAKYLGVSREAVEKWRRENNGPEFIKIGRLVRYRVSAVSSWLNRCAHDS